MNLFDDDFFCSHTPDFNPATGLPMVDGLFDIDGNTYGFEDSDWKDSFGTNSCCGFDD